MLAEIAELFGVSVYCVRVGAEGVRPRDEETNEDDEETDGSDCRDLLEEAMAWEALPGLRSPGSKLPSALQAAPTRKSGRCVLLQERA